MNSLLLYPLLTTALFYLASQAEITQWLWSRYPTWLDRLMSCPACLGFWLGGLCGGLGWWKELPYLGLEPRHWFTPLAVALSAMVWTPILVRKLIDAMLVETQPLPDDN